MATRTTVSARTSTVNRANRNSLASYLASSSLWASEMSFGPLRESAAWALADRSCAGWRDIVRTELLRTDRYDDFELEEAFQRYVLQANMSHLTHLLGLLIAASLVLVLGLIYVLSRSSGLVDAATGGGGGASYTTAYITIASVFVSNIAYVTCLCMLFRRQLSEEFLHYISYILISTFLIQEIAMSRSSMYLWGAIFHVYVTYALLPLRLLDVVISGVALSVVHVPYLGVHHFLTQGRHADSYKRIAANVVILLGLNLVGILTKVPADSAKSKAFDETREFLRAKIYIKEETERQQRLLRTVLPQHLTEQIQAVLGTEDSLRTIHVRTYGPVSIVFADICGFTAMADRESAEQVVRFLNELYSSFDELARINHCLRIKMLGDCYYCVTGLPKPTPYHADYAVNMGLDMITTMAEVRVEYDPSLRIRVGVHSGSVHCGVLGLKKWQFDIWSNDVILANQLESGGLPGKVHISLETKLRLSPGYSFRPAYGVERNSSLRGMSTYFVDARESLSSKTIPRNNDARFHPSISRNPLGRIQDEAEVQSAVLRAMNSSFSSNSIYAMKERLCKTITLRFRSMELEKKYKKEPDTSILLYFINAFVVQVVTVLVQITLLPSDYFRSAASLKGLGVGLAMIVVPTYLATAAHHRCAPGCVVLLSNKILRNRYLTQLLCFITIMGCFLANIIPTSLYEKQKGGANSGSLGGLGQYRQVRRLLQTTEYKIVYSVMAMVMTGSFQVLMFCVKLVVLFAVCIVYIFFLFTDPPKDVRGEDAYKKFVTIITLASFVLLLAIHSQQSEITHRLEFTFKYKARSEKNDIQRLKMKNEYLINNILPDHVARHYLQGHGADTEELYYEKCDSACILFAAITGFSFTGENPTRAIEVLHDIISDFDDILSEEELEDSVEKIKATGPVYMAASGLSLSIGDEYVVKMGDFAVRLKDRMGVINRKHNTSYGIKVGISMGPVVAGVIGASMPQYDIWGNTVNMASRMYSTGIENEIQMTEDVAQIMRVSGFQVTRRGLVYVKGKGYMITYLLTAPRPRPRPSAATPSRRNSPLLWRLFGTEWFTPRYKI